VDWWNHFADESLKTMGGGGCLACCCNRGSFFAESCAAPADRRQTITPIKAEENRGKGVEEREIGNDTESRGRGDARWRKPEWNDWGH